MDGALLDSWTFHSQPRLAGLQPVSHSNKGCVCLTPPKIAVAILFHACQIFHIVAVTCLPDVTDTEKWLGSRTCWPHSLFCMRFANLKKFHKALHRTHQIKGQYKQLCLKYLESWLTTGPSYTYVWAHCARMLPINQNMIVVLILCYLNVLKFPWSPLIHHPHT